MTWLRHSISFALILFFAFISGAQAPLPGAMHPVAQLVAWELNANSAIDNSAYQRMAAVILDRVDASEIPNVAQAEINVEQFKKADSVTRRIMLGKLSLSALKALVVMPAPLEYFVVPVSRLKDLEKYLPHELSIQGLQKSKNIVQFKKDGVDYIRWIIHPLAKAEDSELRAAYKKAFGIDLTARKGFLNFHFTSSRSIIVFGNSYQDAISLKVSLPRSEGPFKNKAIHVKEYTAWSRHNAYVTDLLGGSSLRSMNLMQEPYGLGVVNGDHEDAFIFRNMSDLARAERYYIPAFAVLNDSAGGAIARLNGSNDPLAFWQEYLLEPLARGMAELRARTGAEHTSMHTQNLLVELDSQMRPTGKVVIRDFDFYIDEAVYQKRNRLNMDTEGLTEKGTQYAKFTLRNGLYELPPWMTDANYEEWIEKYAEVYRDEFSKVTGIPVDEIFPDKTIYKYKLGTPVENRKYIRGGANNFHGIKISETANFQRKYANWLQGQNFKLGARVSFQHDSPKNSTRAGIQLRVRCQSVHTH